MKLDFTTWPDGETRREFQVSANDLHLRTETCNFKVPVTVSVTVQKSEDQAVATGQTNTVATAICVRCLDEFDIPLDEAFHAVVRVVPSDEATPDTGDDDFFLVPASNPVWDMAELARQLILLAVPDNPLCRDDCKGLCSGCGRNLNYEACICEKKPAAGGLVRLADLIEKAQRRSR